MKEHDALVDYDPHQLLLYVEKPDGSYGGLQTGAFAVKNYLSQLIEKRATIISSSIEKLKNGEISPVALYLDLNGMTVADLAVRTSLPAAKVRKHLVPSGFARASLDDIRRYADVFNIPVSNLFQAIIPKKDGISANIKKTVNPLFSILEIS